MLGKSLARIRILRLLVAAIVLTVPILVPGQSALRSLNTGPQSRTRGEYSPSRDFLPPVIPLPRPAPANGTEFSKMAHAAGTIFSGTVTAVSRAPFSRFQATETVAITFHVEQGFRGAASGQELTVFQWLGAWAAGQRYNVGDHVLLFLYSPSKLGLTSCVGGSLGRFSVDARGKVTLTAEHQAAFKSDWLLAGKSQLAIGDIQRAVLLAGGSE